MNPQKHFTSVELILMLTSIAVVCLMLPSMMTAFFSSAGDTVCQNNQRQIFSALVSYSQTSGGHAPYVDYELGEGGNSSTRVTWASALSTGKFIKDNSLYFCPAAAPCFIGEIGEKRSRADGAENCIAGGDRFLERYRFINYGINYEYIAGNFGAWNSKNGKELVTAKLPDIKNPAGKIMAADAWNGKGKSIYGRHLISGNIESNRSNRINPCHEGSAVVLWCDGHAALAERPDEILQKGDDATIKRYFNATKGE